MKARTVISKEIKELAKLEALRIIAEETDDVYMRMGNMWLLALKKAGYKASSAERLKSMVDNEISALWNHYADNRRGDGAGDDFMELQLEGYPHYEPKTRM